MGLDNGYDNFFDYKNRFPANDMQPMQPVKENFGDFPEGNIFDAVNYFGNKFNEFAENFDCFSGFMCDKVDFEDLPNGISRYDYKDGIYTIYKEDDKYKREYVGPYGTDVSDFIDNIPEKPIEDKIENNNANENNSLGINGQIDEQVMQGSTGDCWLLVALNSLNSTEKGKQVIKDSIKVNDDNSVTVSFNGVGASYTLSADEIRQYDTDNDLSDSYSNGDNDVLAFELATQKLWDDINSGKVQINSQNQSIRNISDNISDGGLPSQMIYYLTGKESQEYTNMDSNGTMQNIDSQQIYDILSNAYKNGNTSLTFGIYYGEHSGQLTDGTGYSVNVGEGGHAFSITNITADTVTFINPWDNNKEYTMTYAEFANLGIGYMSAGDLNKSGSTNASNTVQNTNRTSNKKDAKSRNTNYSNSSVHTNNYSQNYSGIRSGKNSNPYNNNNIEEFNLSDISYKGGKGKKSSKNTTMSGNLYSGLLAYFKNLNKKTVNG
jgi:hypothetical protein